MPLSTLRLTPRGINRKTQGQDGVRSLLSCRALSSPTTCRFSPAHPQAGLAGKRNGELLTLAEAAGFDVLLTVDKGLPHQQNLSDRVISLLVVRAHSNEIEDLLPHVPACLEALRS